MTDEKDSEPVGEPISGEPQGPPTHGDRPEVPLHSASGQGGEPPTEPAGVPRSDGRTHDVSDAEVDALFADLVARFAAPSAHPVERWPVSEDVEPLAPGSSRATQVPRGDDPARGDGPESSQNPQDTHPSRRRRRTDEPGQDLAGDTTYSAAAEPADKLAEHEKYRTEGESLRLPRDPVALMGWLGVVLGPLILLVIVLGWHNAPSWIAAVAGLAFVGGFIALISQLPSERIDPDDDGAVL